MKGKGGGFSIETRNMFSNQSFHGYNLKGYRAAEARPSRYSRDAKTIL